MACASASPPRFAVSSNQSMSDVRASVADRHDRAGSLDERRRNKSPGRASLGTDPAASLEVLSPTAHSGRAALFKAAGLERSRFAVSAPPARACGPGLALLAMRFYAPRKQSGDARRTDVRVELRSRRSSAAPPSGAMNRRETLKLRHLRSLRRTRPGEPKRALESDPIVQGPPQSFRRPLRVMRRRFSWRGVPLPDHCGRTRPGRVEWSFPLSPGGAHGVQPFAGLLPQTVGSSLLSHRTHLPFHRAVRPD
jgi:hypothetical protein